MRRCKLIDVIISILISAKILLYLSAPTPGRPHGPVTHSNHDYVRLSFRELGQQEVMFKKRIILIGIFQQ